MEQHPIPRQITTFQFKLIGFLTLRQFVYILMFAAVGILVWFALPILIPIPLVAQFLAIVIGLAGIAFAMIPINDRPMDVFIKNFIKRINSPTQFTYKKNNRPIELLTNLYFAQDPHHVFAHVDSKEKLASYIARTRSVNAIDQTRAQKLQQINTAIVSAHATPLPIISRQVAQLKTTQSLVTAQNKAPQHTKEPFFFGVVTNKKGTPLPGALVYVKDLSNKPVRLLKTNPHGVFATYTIIPTGTYILEPQDPTGTYFFDTMKVELKETNNTQIHLQSKEIL
jgi:protocatechuate 3,4-dioxygenase beta subunit